LATRGGPEKNCEHGRPNYDKGDAGKRTLVHRQARTKNGGTNKKTAEKTRKKISGRRTGKSTEKKGKNPNTRSRTNEKKAFEKAREIKGGGPTIRRGRSLQGEEIPPPRPGRATSTRRGLKTNEVE